MVRPAPAAAPAKPSVAAAGPAASGGRRRGAERRRHMPGAVRRSTCCGCDLRHVRGLCEAREGVWEAAVVRHAAEAWAGRLRRMVLMLRVVRTIRAGRAWHRPSCAALSARQPSPGCTADRRPISAFSHSLSISKMASGRPASRQGEGGEGAPVSFTAEEASLMVALRSKYNGESLQYPERARPCRPPPPPPTASPPPPPAGRAPLEPAAAPTMQPLQQQ